MARVSPTSLVLVMQILRGLVDDQVLQVLDCLNIFNIGIDQLALFVQVLGLLLELTQYCGPLRRSRIN